LYKISEAAIRANLPVKTVRYYGDIGLVTPAGRSDSGYRLYTDPDIAKLSFVGRARRYSFSIDQCRELLDLYEDEQRPSSVVKQITLEKIAEIDSRLHELQELRDELQHLAGSCHGDSRPDCPIIGKLSNGSLENGKF
jgi:MerR family copper efflux transcriptional regulator